ncbi:MAG TPA: glucoamylase family protein [Terriglobales bacterium]|nr:glucoamylase family protein [Terriglobales bacterium]
MPSDRRTRREILKIGGGLLLTAPLARVSPVFAAGGPDAFAVAESYSGTDEQLLDETERTAFQFFWEQAHPKTGFVKDRAKTSGNDTSTVASVAATGFGLTALCIADSRAYKPKSEIRDRVAVTLQATYDMSEGHNGFYYHFVDWETGKRAWKCELSSIDTALLLCGVLTAREHFKSDQQIVDVANKINERVQWRWMLNVGDTLSMGWKPESGFLDARWNHYCELMMMYLLGMGAPKDPLPASTWSAWTRPKYTYEGITYISSGDPLFTHQYSQAWFDFRNKRDAYANYFENSVKATQAHKLFCLSLKKRFPTYANDMWGITSSDSQHGYVAWGGPPAMGPIDGTVVPCAPGGSIPFLYDDCILVLRKMRTMPGVWGRYGYTDAFNPGNGWVNPDVIGIDVGITMIMAENQRSGFVWSTFMGASEARKGMSAAGFHESHSAG